jgi:hypothetical protein
LFKRGILAAPCQIARAFDVVGHAVDGELPAVKSLSQAIFDQAYGRVGDIRAAP